MIIDGVEFIASLFVPERSAQVATDDYLDRLHAMTLHHIDLSLIDLTRSEHAVFVIGGRVYCHPNTLAVLCAECDTEMPR